MSLVTLKESTHEGKNCLSCKHFNSYRNIYEDEQEPHDCGLCGFPHGGRIDEHSVSENSICDLHEERAKEQANQA